MIRTNSQVYKIKSSNTVFYLSKLNKYEKNKKEIKNVNEIKFKK